MGTWGPGNFDDDTAADHLSSITHRLLDDVAKAMAGDPVELESDEYWGVAVPCNVELLALLAEQKLVGVTRPDRETVLAWKERYLTIWDATIDNLSPVASPAKAKAKALSTADIAVERRFAAWKEKRRIVLARTFDRLAVCCEPAPAKAPIKVKKPKTKSATKSPKGS